MIAFKAVDREPQTEGDAERRGLSALPFARAALPPSLAEVGALQFEALYLPCRDDIGGDWYDTLALPDNSVLVTVGDVVGHGIEAAALMGELRYSLRATALQASAMRTGSAASLLSLMEDALQSEHPEASATMFLGIISPDRKQMDYANAGHPPPIVVMEAGGTAWLEGGGTPLGWGDGLVRKDYIVDLTGIRHLILYTDGVIEAGREIIRGLERLQATLEDPELQNVKDLLPWIVEKSVTTAPHDDIAMLAVTFD